MEIRNQKMNLCRDTLIALVALVSIIGCGGGGDSSSSGVVITSPNAKSKSDLSSHVFALGQSIASTSLTGYGPKLQTHGLAFFDNGVGLWATTRLGPSGLQEGFFEDEAETIPAGTLIYATNDVTRTQSGDVNLTSGRLSGLTGSYSQSLLPNGYSGNINYSVPGTSTCVCQFAVQQNSSGAIVGNGTTAVALASGYSQTDQIVYNDDGTILMSTTDGVSSKGSVTFATDLSGSAKITGTDLGLPANVSWNSKGTGKVTWADGSTQSIIAWNLAG